MYMEYIRRFSSFLSKLNCNTDSVKTNTDVQKCNDEHSREKINNIDS